MLLATLDFSQRPLPPLSFSRQVSSFNTPLPSPAVELIALGVFFSLYVNTFHGIRNVDAGLIEMGKSYGLSPWDLFWQVIFPGALPSILLGVRLALGITWLGLIVAETLATNEGIGHLATEAREFFRTSDLIFTIILYALLGKSSDLITRFLERRLLRWSPAYQKLGKAPSEHGRPT